MNESEPTHGEPHDEYLWTGRGRAPADIARLQGLLKPYRYRPGRAPIADRRVGWGRLALAASIAVAATAALYLGVRRGTGGWSIINVQGTPMIAGGAATPAGVLGVGQWLQTDAASSAVVDAAGIGHVTVGPGSRVRLVATGAAQHRMELAQGGIEAFITAPPRLFFVDTPSAVAVDYGCIYSLDVQPDGSTRLRVTLGLVKLVSRGTESAVPRGLECRSVKGAAPGTPFDPGADPAFLAALAEIDSVNAAPPGVVDSLLAAARPRDRVTLWHLLSRVQPELRPRVYAALAKFTPPPRRATLDAVARLDPAALEDWWRAVYADF